MQRPPREIREYYDRLSRSYGTLYGPEQAMKHEKVLARMERRMYSVFIDIGCGDGVLLSKVRGRSGLQVGLDFSPKMLERARHVLGESGNLVRGEACHLPFREEVADCIVSISLSDRGNIEALASEVARIARYDTTLLLSVIHPDGSPLTTFPGLKVLSRSLLSTRETLLVLSKHRPMLKNEWRGMDGGTIMSGCSHQWRGRGQMARCMRCGKLKSEFRREQHEQKMAAKNSSTDEE